MPTPNVRGKYGKDHWEVQGETQQAQPTSPQSMQLPEIKPTQVSGG